MWQMFTQRTHLRGDSNNAGCAQVRLRLACQPCNRYRLSVNRRVYSTSLREGGGIFARKWRKEPAAFSPSARHKTSTFLSYTRAPPTLAACGICPHLLPEEGFPRFPPPYFFFPSAYRHSLYRTTRLSRGFCFTKKSPRLTEGFLLFEITSKTFW